MASRALKNRPSAKKKHPIKGLLVALTIVVGFIMATAVSAYAIGASWIGDLTSYDVSEAAELNIARPTEVYAADKTTMLAKFQLENRDPVEYGQISPYVLAGTVATEDERFYDHTGFDVPGIARAFIVNLTGSGREGASTITQQFVRNTILADEMDDISLKRKVREMYLSVKLEQTYTKEEILLMYLNTINYGNGTYGIQAASQRYFSKDAIDLTLDEAAALVGIPQSPTYNNPLVDNGENCLSRRNLVLDRMLSNNYITQAEYDQALVQPLVLNQSVPSNDGILAYPYFTSYVRNTLLETYSTNEVFKGGLKVYTTLDIPTQEAAEAAVAEKEATLGNAIQGSLVAIDPSTGHVKALVGGRDYYTNETNLATGQGTSGGRPCGSTFKTFTLVAALEAGISPQTMVNCGSPAVLPEAGYPASNPLNNIDHINFGTISMQKAFAKSSNTGFVRLQMAVGTDKVLEKAESMGITSPLNAVGSLTLGTQNVTMLDMSKAYACIANGGTRYEAQPVLEVYDHRGNLLVNNATPQGERVMEPEVARAATEVMKTVVTDYGATGNNARLANGQQVAAKTGTSTEYHDITFCGITPQLSVAIWFGDPSNKATLPAHVGADDVFSNFMDRVLFGQSPVDFPYAPDLQYPKPPYSNSKYGIGAYASTSDDKDKTDDKDKENVTEDKDLQGQPYSGNSDTTTDPSSGNEPGSDPATPGGGSGGTTPSPGGGSSDPGGGGSGGGAGGTSGSGATP